MIDLVNTPGTIVMSKDGYSIVGATKRQNEAFRARMKTYSVSEEALKAGRDAAELAGIRRVEYGSADYYNMTRIKGMPGSVFGTNFGYGMQKEIAGYMQDYYSGKISAEEVKEQFNECCSSMRIYCAQKRLTNGQTKADNEQIVSQVYEIFAKENARAARAANCSEGSALNQEIGESGRDDDWLYYNSEYYHKCEETKGMLREAVSSMEEKWGLGKIDCDAVEKNSKLTLDGGFDFNSSWNWRYRVQTGIGSMEDELAVPPEDFRLYYKENYKGNKGILKAWAALRETSASVPFYASEDGISGQTWNAASLVGFQKSDLESCMKYNNFLKYFSVFSKQGAGARGIR